MGATTHVELDHREVRTVADLSAWAAHAFALAGRTPGDFNELTRQIWQQVGARAGDFQVTELNTSEASEQVAHALAVWRPYFGQPMFHDWGCEIQFAA